MAARDPTSETGPEPREPRLLARRALGVDMLIAIDSTRRGPALGGCRWQPFDDLSAAREEARALAAGMTRKSALAGLALGGGKAVVVGDPRSRTRAQLHAFGDFVESLGGDYVTAEDMGTGPEALLAVAERTPHVAGLPAAAGGSGDPSPYTAEGVLLALRAALRHRGRDLEDARVAVQGVGAVGARLARLLIEAGAHVLVSDRDRAALDEVPRPVEIVPTDDILSVECDVFAPCGPPRVLDDATAEHLPAAIVCGAANTPLANPGVARRLAERNVLYVPDFVANAGGIIQIAVRLAGGDDAEARRRLSVIPRNLERILSIAEGEGRDTLSVAERLAREALASPPGA